MNMHVTLGKVRGASWLVKILDGLAPFRNISYHDIFIHNMILLVLVKTWHRAMSQPAIDTLLQETVEQRDLSPYSH